MARVSDSPLRYGNDLRLLENGPTTYKDWLAEIRNAQRWVHLENYIFRADEIGYCFADVLSAKARQACRYASSTTGSDRWTCHAHSGRSSGRAGVDVRAVNPPAIQAPLDFLRRDHRKLLAVDGIYASAGGVCIADTWLRRSPETNLPYRDTAVSVRGPAVADLERAFAGVWDETGDPLPGTERPRAAGISSAGEMQARVVIQEPGKARILRVLQFLMAEVEERMWIADAYFLSVPGLTQAVMAAARDGVDVRILLPATNDLPWIGFLSRIGYHQLLESGVRIYEYGGLMMHAKTSVADGLWGRVGSTNLNVSGLLVNWEVDILAEDPSFGAEMEKMFEEDLDDAREIFLGGTPRRPRAVPERRISPAERRVQRETPGSGPRAVATASRLGSAVFMDSGAPVRTHQRKIGAALAASALGRLGSRRPLSAPSRLAARRRNRFRRNPEPRTHRPARLG
jgi:cardiolipin synthase